MSFPSKVEREKCWASRDDFWKCLDENEGSQEVCSKFRKLYESTCPSQWVKHFDRKREYLKFKDRIQKEGSWNVSCNISTTGAGSITSKDFVGEEEGNSVSRGAASGSRMNIGAAAADATGGGGGAHENIIRDLDAVTTTTMISCRRRRRTDDDKEVLLNVCASGISLQIPNCSATNENDDKLNVLHNDHVMDKDSQQLTAFSSTGSNSPGGSTSTKVPSPRIFRRWQAFQPPTFS